MFNSAVLDVVIGLIFIYLLYSLLATIIQEILASAFCFRGKILERAILRMLEDENKSDLRITSVFGLFKKSGHGALPDTTSYVFYNHPLIKFLGENKLNSKPAYINKQTFSKVLVDLLRGDKVKPGDDIKHLIQKALDEKTVSWGVAQISDETLSYLRSIWADAEGDVEQFKISLENWFEATMERASGWYKKNIQFILFFIGFTIAVVFNVDTIKIISNLEKDPKLREQLLQQADAFSKAHPNLDQQLAEQKALNAKYLLPHDLKNNQPLANTDSTSVEQSEDSLSLAQYTTLSARRDTLFRRADSLINTDLKKANNLLGLGWDEYEYKSLFNLLKSLLGWIITALALSLGAPFWFDLLNKMMKMRATGSSSGAEAKSGAGGSQSAKTRATQ